MITCDICDDEIKRIASVYTVPSEYDIAGVNEISKITTLSF